MVDLRSTVSKDFKDEFLAKATAEGLTQSQAVSQALEQWLQPSQALTLGDNNPVTYFSNVTGSKREKLLTGLEEYDITPDSEGNVTLTPQQLLSLASQLSEKSEGDILAEGLSYIGQKLVTQALSSASKQGTLGSADPRIMTAIKELRDLIAEGAYKPRKVNGVARLGDSVIAGKAMTSVSTVRNFISRKGPEIEKLLDVSELC
jgi:hypothetical protein